MNKISCTRFAWFFALLSLLVIQTSCALYKTFPNVARAGDTISLAVGSADGMTKEPSNTTAKYVANGIEYPLTIRSVFNLYPDKKSRMNKYGAIAGNIVSSSGHEVWQTVMILDVPTDVPVGAGNVQIQSIATYPTIGSHINSFPIALEIIDGVGAPDNFVYEFGVLSSMTGNLTQLEARPYALVAPPNDLSNTYGAIEVKLSLPTNLTVPLEDYYLKIVEEDMMLSTYSLRNVSWGVKNDELIVMFISRLGLLTSTETRMSILLQGADFTGVPIINEVNYFDVDGLPVTGPDVLEYNVVLR